MKIMIMMHCFPGDYDLHAHVWSTIIIPFVYISYRQIDVAITCNQSQNDSKCNITSTVYYVYYVIFFSIITLKVSM